MSRRKNKRKERIRNNKDGRKGNNQGNKAEELVTRLAEEFIQKRTIFNNNHKITRCVRASKNSSHDHNGIDITLVFNSGLSMPLQVGTSRKKIRQHKKNYPDILHVFIIEHIPRTDISRARLRRRLKDGINNAITNAYQSHFLNN